MLGVMHATARNTAEDDMDVMKVMTTKVKKWAAEAYSPTCERCGGLVDNGPSCQTTQLTVSEW
jgi:hypothetical protein